jgi:valyl-tRNA synthetase
MVAPYPQPDPAFAHPEAEAEMNLVMAAITAIRNIRGEMNVPPATQVEVFLHSPEAVAIEALSRHQQAIKILGRVQELHCNAASGPPAAAAKAVVDKVDIFMPLAGIIDFTEEAKRLDRELEKLGKEVSQAQRKMSNEDFLAKAPAEVVQKEQAKLQAQTDKLTKLKTHRGRIKELMG